LLAIPEDLTTTHCTAARRLLRGSEGTVTRDEVNRPTSQQEFLLSLLALREGRFHGLFTWLRNRAEQYAGYDFLRLPRPQAEHTFEARSGAPDQNNPEIMKTPISAGN
jgi:hypothetical protein